MTKNHGIEFFFSRFSQQPNRDKKERKKEKEVTRFGGKVGEGRGKRIDRNSSRGTWDCVWNEHEEESD